jgi:hypothetical protein
MVSGCCRPDYGDLPSRPAQVNGWKKSTFTTVLIIGSFVLNKGESTENEKLGVTLVDLKPSILCKRPLSEPSNSQIKLRFYNPSNKQVLCETTIYGPSSGNISGNLDCPDKSDLPLGFRVRSFNAKDGWGWLELTSTVGDVRW